MKRICIIDMGLVSFVSLAGSISKDIKLNASNNGSQIDLEKNHMLVINLEANPSTGYTWEVAELDEHVLRQVGETEFQPESSAIGASGVQILHFKAINAGKTPLKLVYHRSWEKDVEPIKIFFIQVVVR